MMNGEVGKCRGEENLSTKWEKEKENVEHSPCEESPCAVPILQFPPLLYSERKSEREKAIS